jgi:hypothetical protein
MLEPQPDSWVGLDVLGFLWNQVTGKILFAQRLASNTKYLTGMETSSSSFNRSILEIYAIWAKENLQLVAETQR